MAPAPDRAEDPAVDAEVESAREDEEDAAVDPDRADPEVGAEADAAREDGAEVDAERADAAEDAGVDAERESRAGRREAPSFARRGGAVVAAAAAPALRGASAVSFAASRAVRFSAAFGERAAAPRDGRAEDSGLFEGFFGGRAALTVFAFCGDAGFRGDAV